MFNKIDDQGKKLSDTDLELFSQTTGFNLPSDYKGFLLSYNGGTPDFDTFFIKGHDEGISGVHAFFGIEREIDSSCLDWNYAVYKNRIPNLFLPIACSDSNDLICLDLSKGNYGSVMFWDSYDEKEPADSSNVYKIASCFSNFIDSLFADEDE